MYPFFKTLGVALAGALLFYALKLPLAWLLGSLAAISVVRYFGLKDAVWPEELHKVGLLLLGYTLGSNFGLEMFRHLLVHLPAMLISTIVLVFLCVLLAFVLSRLTGVSSTSLIIGSMPGGLSQMLILGEETKGADLTVVTLMQVIRLMTVVFVVPWTVIGLSKGTMTGSEKVDPSISGYSAIESALTSSDASYSWVLILFLFASLGAGWLATRLRLPTPYLLGPILITIILIIAGLEATDLPAPLFMLAQLLIGARLGLKVDFRKIFSLRKLGLYTFLSNLFLLLFTLVTAYVIARLYAVPFVAAYLGSSPGGMVEMGITAREVHTDVVLVTGYQLFRIFFLLIVVPPVLTWALKKWSRAEEPALDHEQISL